MKKFALIGAAGFVAPRHMKAIKETGNALVAAYDISDSVGIIDSYAPDAHFFTELGAFDRHIHELSRRGSGERIDYVSICSPNYLHDTHARLTLGCGADAIVEKPLALNPEDIDGMAVMERETGRRVWTILQLRLHPAIQALRKEVDGATGKGDVDLTYITSRGRWYLQSWKGDERKSGGIATNIGVHFFDMLHFVFGNLLTSVVHMASETRAAGFLEYEKARVRWFLSVEIDDVPEAQRAAGQRTFRSITMNGREIDFSAGFTDLHTSSYEAILNGKGFPLQQNRCAIETVAGIRRATPARRSGDFHPFLKKIG